MMRVHRNRNYNLVKNNKQPQAKKVVNGVCANKLLVVVPLTMKLGTPIHHGKVFTKTENTMLYITTNSLRQKRLSNGVTAYNLLMMGPLK